MNAIISSKKGQFGYITPIGGNNNLFFHFSGCVDKLDGFNALSEGMEVSFEVQDGQKVPTAVNVQEVAML